MSSWRFVIGTVEEKQYTQKNYTTNNDTENRALRLTTIEGGRCEEKPVKYLVCVA